MVQNTLWSYIVTYKPEGVATDITDPNVQRLTVELDGTGIIRSGKLVLNGTDGNFMSNSHAGTTPILTEFDKIRIQITDQFGNTPADDTLEIDVIYPLKSGPGGYTCEVDLLGPERHQGKIPFAKQYYFENGFNIGKDIIDFYNDPDSKGLGQPVVIDHDNSTGNQLPKFTASQMDFNISEITTYQALIELVDRMGSSTPAGGGGDFWELAYETDTSNFNQIKFRAKKSGIDPSPGSEVTISEAISVNPAEEEGGLHSTEGTVNACWGANGFGSLRANTSLFAGALEAWPRLSNFDATITTYPSGSITRRADTGPDDQGDEFHYKANKDTGIAPPTTETSNADWDIYHFRDFLTIEIGFVGDYSPFTNFRNDAWKNSGANQSGTQLDDPPSFTSLQVFDGNLVFQDGNRIRTWVHTDATNPASISANYKYTGNFYRGFRNLVNGTGVGDFASFSNEVVEFTGTAWRKFRTTGTDDLCAVRFSSIGGGSAIVFEKNSGGTWVDVSATDQTQDCFHAVFQITNTQGWNNKLDGAGGDYGDNSAVRYEFRYSKSDLTTLNASKYYRIGAWVNMEIPFSPSSFNGETIGNIFGNNATKREPVTLDINNMHLSPSGKVGFNNNEAKEKGPLEGIKFANTFSWRYQKDGSGSFVNAGNFKCKCFIFDTSDNVDAADFTIPVNGLWEEIFIPWSQFKPYRGRLPIAFGNLSQNIFLQGIEILNRFEFKNIKLICWQWTGPYDSDGRYFPIIKQDIVLPSLEDILLGLVVDGYNIKWDIDVLNFPKPILSITSPQTGGGERALFPEFNERPFITNHYQNDQANLADNEISRFRLKEFEVTTIGATDIKLFDTFFLNDPILVNDADTRTADSGGTPNTIRLVAKKIKYTIDKFPQGPGGFLRTITGVKRLIA